MSIPHINMFTQAIVINDKTAVQNMPESRAHLFRFRVLDGSSATPTEISSTEEFTMREWMAFIKLVRETPHTCTHGILKRL